MSETRRDALKLSVLTALGLPACAGSVGMAPQITPVDLPGQPDILVNTDQGNNVGSWIFLEYAPQTGNYQVYTNSAPLPTAVFRADLGNHPDLNAASSLAIWGDYRGGNTITIQGTNAQLPVALGQPPPNATPTTTTPSAVQDLGRNSQVAQHAWNEIGKQ